MTDERYSIQTDIKFEPLQLIDVQGFAAQHEPWFNQSLCRINDCVARIGILHGEFHWHKHDEEDEFFYVLEGRLGVEWEGGNVELQPGQGLLMPKGVMHITRAPVRTVVLMVEGAGVVPTGD